MSLQFEWDPRKAKVLVSFTCVEDYLALARQRARSAKIMKKTSVRKKRESPQDTLRSEYRFDYGKSKPNRFAAKMSQSTVAVVLEPDVVAVFKSSEAVNALLRSVISAMPESKSKRRRNGLTKRY